MKMTKNVLKPCFSYLYVKSGVGMLFSNRGEKVGIGHFKKVDFQCINISGIFEQCSVCRCSVYVRICNDYI